MIGLTVANLVAVEDEQLPEGSYQKPIMEEKTVLGLKLKERNVIQINVQVLAMLYKLADSRVFENLNIGPNFDAIYE